VSRSIDVFVPTTITIPILFASVTDIWRLAFVTAINDKWLEGFAIDCAERTFPAKFLTTAKAIRADISTITLPYFHAKMLGFGCTLSFVTAGLDLFGYSRRILSDDFPYLGKLKAL